MVCHLVLPRVAIVLLKGRYDETFAGEDGSLPDGVHGLYEQVIGHHR